MKTGNQTSFGNFAKLLALYLGGTLSVALLLGSTGCDSNDDSNDGNATKITLAEFNEVTNRAHYAEVRAIVGNDPTTKSTTTGPAGGEATAYQWQNPDDSSGTIVLESDAVYLKSQSGLK